MSGAIVVSGEVLWDLFEGKPNVFHARIGGSAANTTVELARLGADVRLEGRIGKDELGDELENGLRDEGVKTRLVRDLPRTGIVFVRNGRFFPYRSDTPTGITHARMGGRELVDLNARPHGEMRFDLSRAVLVKASLDDLSRIAGSERAGLAWLAKKAPRAVWIVTRGPLAASAYFDGERIDVPAPRRRTGAFVGAGDAFFAGVLATIAEAGPRWRSPVVLTRALVLGHRLGARRSSWR